MFWISEEPMLGCITRLKTEDEALWHFFKKSGSIPDFREELKLSPLEQEVSREARIELPYLVWKQSVLRQYDLWVKIRC